MVQCDVDLSKFPTWVIAAVVLLSAVRGTVLLVSEVVLLLLRPRRTRNRARRRDAPNR